MVQCMVGYIMYNTIQYSLVLVWAYMYIPANAVYSGRSTLKASCS